MRANRSVLLLVLVGCAKAGWSPVSPSGDVEQALLAYTSTYAARLGWNVRGEITDTRKREQLDAAGWYDRGVAYYYRPAIHDFVTLTDGECPAAPRCELASGIAAHEVAHFKYPFHDMHHWCCMVNLGVRPTYPPPETVNGQWPVCDPSICASR